MPGERNPLLIVKEYLHENNEQVRLNAVAALAVLNSDESVRELAHAALADDEESVRQAAEEEIAGLDAGSQTAAFDRLRSEVAKGGEAGLAAYALLGRFSNRGLHTGAPALGSLAARIRLAKDYSRSRRGGWQWLERLKPGKPAAISGAISGALMLLASNLVLGLNLDSGSLAGLAAIGAFTACAFGIVVTFYTSPIRLQADLAAAALLEIGFAALVGLALAAITVALAKTENQPTLPLVAVLVAGPLWLASIRAGTLLGFGFASSSRLNRAVQALTGGSLGLAVISLAFSTPRLQNDALIGGVWLWTAPAGFGIASAYAYIDAHSRPKAVVSSRYQGYVPAVLVMLPVLLFSAFYGRPKQALLSFPNGGARSMSYSITSVPTAVQFTAAALTHCHAQLDPLPQRYEKPRYVVEVVPVPVDIHQPAQALVRTGIGQQTIEWNAPAGSYKLVVDRNPDVPFDLSDIWPEFARRLIASQASGWWNPLRNWKPLPIGTLSVVLSPAAH